MQGKGRSPVANARRLERWKRNYVTLWFFLHIDKQFPSCTLSQSLVKAEQTLPYSRALRYDLFIWSFTSSVIGQRAFVLTFCTHWNREAPTSVYFKIKWKFFFHSGGSGDVTWRLIWWNHPFGCHRWNRNRKTSYSGQRTTHILWRVKVE